MGEVGKRPFGERWTFFFLLTAWAWVRVVVTVVDPSDRSVSDWIALGLLVVGAPLFAWHRRSTSSVRKPDTGDL